MNATVERVANGLILRIEDGGLEGLGEATPLAGRSRETLEEAEAALRAWVNGGFFRNLARDDASWADLNPHSGNWERMAPLPAARFAAETALFDLAAARRGTTIAGLFGGAREIDRAVGGAHGACHSGFALEANALAALDEEAVAAAVARGARTVKIKIGREPFLETLRRVRARFPTLALRLDVNAGWSLDEARAHLASLVPIRPEYVEQPVADLFALPDSPVPIAADEQASRLPPIASVIVLKPMVLGGFAACRDLAARARAAGKDVVVTHSADGPIALAAAREVAQVVGCTRACGLDEHAGLAAWPRLVPGSRRTARGATEPDPEPRLARPASAGDRPALAAGGREWTFAQVEREIEQIAAPEVSAIVAHPVPETVFAILAALRQGRWIAPLHPRLPEDERAARAAALPRTRPLPGAGIVVSTSGSAGRPKAALLPLRSWVASAEASCAALPLGPGDRWLLAMPLAHVGGISILTRSWLAGSTVALAERFDPSALDGITLVSLVPAQLARWLDAGVPAPRSLRAVLLGGGAASPALLARARDAGLPVLATYGLTEACSQVATQREPALEGCGLPLPGTGIRVENDRIQVRGPTLFAGYLGEPPPFLPGGWFDTGDVGRLDPEGTLHVLGRADDRITTGGEKVDPVAVERVLESCPGIASAVVFGADDATWGQVVCAAFTGAAREEAVAAFARERLAPFQRPRRLVRLAELPLGATGKIDRRRVAETARAIPLRRNTDV